MRPSVLVLSLILASGAPAAPAPLTLEEAAARLEASSREQDPVQSRRQAEEALGALRALAAPEDAPCKVLLLTAEAALRAIQPATARQVLDRARNATCNPGVLAQLTAWSLEFNDQSVRRGPGAKLLQAERSYVEAALLLSSDQPSQSKAAALCLLRASELADARGDHEQAMKNALAGLKLGPPAPQRIALGLQYVTCASPRDGEGAALDALGPILQASELQDVGDARMNMLKPITGKDSTDAVALAALGYYSWLAREDPKNLIYAERYLTKAAAIDDGLPDLWYQFGRLREETGRLDEARDNYRRQLREHPSAPASRLAANQLAQLIASQPKSPAELDEALALMNAQLAKTPDEGAMLDTRAHVLMALGRDREALADLERAFQLTKDPEVGSSLDRLRARLAAKP